MFRWLHESHDPLQWNLHWTRILCWLCSWSKLHLRQWNRQESLRIFHPIESVWYIRTTRNVSPETTRRGSGKDCDCDVPFHSPLPLRLSRKNLQEDSDSDMSTMCPKLNLFSSSFRSLTHIASGSSDVEHVVDSVQSDDRRGMGRTLQGHMWIWKRFLEDSYFPSSECRVSICVFYLSFNTLFPSDHPFPPHNLHTEYAPLFLLQRLTIS